MAEIDGKLIERLAKALESLEGGERAEKKRRKKTAAETESAAKKARAERRMRAKDDEEHLANLQKELKNVKEIDVMYERRYQKRALQAEIEEAEIQRHIDNLEKQKKMSGSLTEADEERLVALKKQQEKLGEQLDKLDEIKDAMEELEEHAEKFASALEIGESIDAVGALSDGFDFVKAAIAGGTDGIMAFAEQLGGNIMFTMINNMAGLALEAVNSQNAFMKATGAGADLAGVTTDVYEATRLYGTGLDDAVDSATNLFKTTTDFTMMAYDQQKALAETGAILEELGVSLGDYAMGIQISTKMLGQNAMQAEATSRELVAFAKDIGVAPEQMASQFASAGGTLAKFGKDGVKAFKDISMISKITGMDMEKILSITNKFDTFEGAADQAGKLNAALGGNFVNAMDLMMTTDPAERFNMIRDSILDAGLSFDDMSYYQKNFYKDALGLSDVGDLAMMLSGNMDTLTGDLGKNSDELVAMKENAAAVASIQEQLTALVAEMTPVLTGLMDAIRGVVGFLREYSGALKVVVGLFVAYKAGIYAILAIEKTKMAMDKAKLFFTSLSTKANNALAESQENVNKATTKGSMKMQIFLMAIRMIAFYLFQKQFASNFVEGIGKMAQAFQFVGQALDAILEPLSNNIKGILALGAAVLMMGGGVALAAVGMADLARAFGEVGDNGGYAVAAIAMVGAIVLGLAASIIALVVYTGGVGAAAILAFGAAFLMLGAGVALAAMGVKTFVEASQGVSFAAMAELASGLYMVGGAMALLGLPPSLLGAMVLSVLSANMIALSAAAEKLPFVADMMEMLGTVIEAVTAPLRVMESVFETLTDPQRIADLAVGFVAIADAIDKIPTTKAVAMTATLGATAAAATATAVVGGGAAMATNVVSAMGGAQAAPTQVQAQERPYQVTINLQMGDEIIKTEVVDIVGGIAKRAIGLM